MTDVDKSNQKLVHTREAARALYAPNPDQYSGKIGIEVEMHLYRPGARGPEIPSPDAMEALRHKLAAKGHDAQLEATGVLEYASPAVGLKQVSGLVARIGADMTAFEKAAEEDGFQRAPFSLMPGMTVDAAAEKMGRRERLRVGIGVAREIMPREALCVPLLTTGVQVSFSPRNADEMHRMAYRAYALTPLVIAAMNSCSGYAEGKKIDFHPRGKYYDAYGAAGGISPAFLAADGAESFVQKHIEEVFNARMLFAYGSDGQMIPSTRDRPLSFASLVEQGLGTQANYELAESFLYNDVKICNLRDATGQTLGKRLEVRAADAGFHQPASMVLLTAALVPDGLQAVAFEDLLKGFGFTGIMPDDGDLMLRARKSAIEHGGAFMDVPFGRDPATGRERSLRELAQGVADILTRHYTGPGADMGADAGVDKALSKLTGILRNGQCDARVFAEQFATLQQAENSLSPVSGRARSPETLLSGRRCP